MLDPSILLNCIFFGLFALAAFTAIWKLVQGRFAKPKTVRAEVIGKQTVERFSKNAPKQKSVRYVVIFLAEGKKKSFYVSEFSYNGYRKGEKGQLTYQGDRLIDFH